MAQGWPSLWTVGKGRWYCHGTESWEGAGPQAEWEVESQSTPGGQTSLSQAWGSPRETPLNLEAPGVERSWKNQKEGMKLSGVMERTPGETESAEARTEAFKTNCPGAGAVLELDKPPWPGPSVWGARTHIGDGRIPTTCQRA